MEKEKACSCNKGETCCSTESKEDKEVMDQVKKYYSELKSNKDLKAVACTSCKPIQKFLRKILINIPSEITEKFYGCGTPLPSGIDGLTVLDLGSGTGRDCYMAAKLVGPKGKVYGIDMTDSQLEVARKYVDSFTKDYLKYDKPNMEYFKGYIEHISEIKEIKPESVDIVISNCVINLCPNKLKVLKEVYNALKFGGEFYFSDVYSDRRLNDEAKKSEILVGECIGGALYINDFIAMCKEVGFTDPRVLEKSIVPMKPGVQNDPNISKLFDLLGETKFYSITYRLFKLKNLEPNCEDYGQVAIYNGKIDENPNSYLLDNHHFFEKNKPVLVCGNSSSMLSESWLKPYFTVIGDRSVHYGQFPCGETSFQVDQNNKSEKDKESCCTSGGGCC